MAKEVDNKVVSITFDNASFGRKMNETIASLDRLSKSLDMAGSKRGLSELSAQSNKFDLSHMGTAVEGMSAKFLGLATVGITALANLTNKAVDAGLQFGKSFTLAPVTAGFSEFELKMGSIQTIMAGSGASLGKVNQKLNELNTYSDKTIYSFQDMTSNIGKFTNAGVSLDKSVDAIQGVANVAAVSGANAEEASRAMYNFGQALSAGHVKLIDWKSIELANMGTTEFKQQLIDSGIAMKTLKKASDGTITTLKGTEVTTKNFNTTLADQWLTSEALTKTLGDYSNTQTAIGKKATKAATQVKTFSQMLDTMKEGLQSGWAQSFEHIFGDFNEGVELWTGIKKGFDDIVGKSAESRNKMLGMWKAFGARDALLEGLKESVKGLGTILKPIKEAFREIFPKKTAKDLIILTDKFRDFAKTIRISGDTAEKLKNGFKTFFAILDIGWEIIKGVVGVFFTLGKAILGVVGPLLGLLGGNSKFVHSLHETLVVGGGIKDFFDMLDAAIMMPFEGLKKLTSAVGDFIDSLNPFKRGGEDVEETGKKVEKTAGFFQKLLDSLKNVFGQIGDFLSDIGESIAGAFKGLGGAIAGALGSGDFGQVLDIIKTGLLGGILTMLVKFFRNGIKFDFGQGKLFDKIGKVFDTLTSSIKSLQANVRADTLMKIAIAMGILTVAIVALSLIDGKALAKSMAAIAVGFTQLTAVMLLLEKASAGGGGFKIMAMSIGIVALATAMALLVIPIKVLSTMDMVELAKGLAGVTVGMLVMAKAIQIMGSGHKGIIRASAGMILISVAMLMLASAIKKFAEMNLSEMAWGLAQAAFGIGLLIVAMRNMPSDVAAKGIGLLILAFSLKSLARVVQLFAGISLGVLAKGFIAIALGLAYIGNAMRTFPDDMIKKSIALVIMSGALYLIGKAIEKVGELPFGTLVKGVLALGIMLNYLAGAIMVMSMAEGGVAALILGAAGLLIMGHAVEQVGKLPFDVLIKGIIGLAAVLAVLGIASVLAPGIYLLGLALAAVGAAFILFGAGIALAGVGFKYFAKYGTEGLAIVIDAMQAFIRELPGFVSAFVVGILQAAVEVGKEFPKLIGTLVSIISSILTAIREAIPQFGATISEFITEGLRIFREAIPEFVDAGFELLLGWLRGLEENIGEITHTVGDIIVAFLDAFAEEVPDIIESLTDLIISVFNSVAFNVGRAVPELLLGVGASFLDGFVQGIIGGVSGLFTTITGLIGDIIGWFTSGFGIFSPSRVMMDIGKNIIQGMIDGVKGLFGILKTVFIEIPGKVVRWIGNAAKTLFNKGKDFIGGLLDGIKDKIIAVKDWYLGLGPKIREWVGNAVGVLRQKGYDFIAGLASGIFDRIKGVTKWFKDIGNKIKDWIGDAAEWLFDAGKKVITGLWEGIKAKKDWLVDKAKDIGGWVTNPVGKVLEMASPSKVFMRMGKAVGQGLINGLHAMGTAIRQTSGTMGNKVKEGWERARVALSASVGDLDEMNPTIAPVLDLSKVRAEAKNLDKYMNVSSIAPDVSIDRANAIALATNNQNGSDSGEAVPAIKEVTYNQTINAPKELSTADIYRQTKGLIAVTKDEMEVA